MKPNRSLAGIALTLMTLPVMAAPIVYTAQMNSAQENNPANTSPGTGTVTLTLDDVAQTMVLDVNFSGLQGQTTVGHVHCCIAPPGNANPATTVPSFPGFPSGVTSGSYSQTFDMSQASSYNPAFITANGGTPAGALAAFSAGLAAGQAYFNVHTNLFSAGEIRGQLSVVPLPGAFGLMSVALACIGGLLRPRLSAKAG